MTNDNSIRKGLIDALRGEFAQHIRIDDAIRAELKSIYANKLQDLEEWTKMLHTMEHGDRPMSPVQQIQVEAIARLIVLYIVHLLQGRRMEDKFPQGFDKESPTDSNGKEDWLMDAGRLKLLIDTLKEIRVP